jgi:hypothetical protein
MGALELIVHGANFLAPAFFVSLVLSLFTQRWAVSRLSFAWSFAINIIATCAVLTLGIAYFGNDGKMWTYGAMCGAGGLAAALLAKPSRA